MRKVFSDPKKFYIPIASIVLGLIVGFIIVLISGKEPSVVLYTISRPFREINQMGNVLMALTPLIFTGLAVAFAFRTGLFNIGVEGQFIMGRFAGFLIAFFLAPLGLPPFLLISISLLGAMLAGGFWGAIPGYLKAKFGVHEVIVTIMMNWIALTLTRIAVNTQLRESGGQPKTELIPEVARLSNKALSDFFNTDFHVGIFIALVVSVIIYILLFKTTIGFELRAVGFSPKAAEYAGMNVKKNMVLSMAISGALGGIAGAIQVMGMPPFRLSAEAILPGYGFDGIAVSLIGNNHPFGIILGAFMMGILAISRNLLQAGPKYPKDLISIIIAIFIYFIAAKGFISWIIEEFKRSFIIKQIMMLSVFVTLLLGIIIHYIFLIAAAVLIGSLVIWAWIDKLIKRIKEKQQLVTSEEE